MTARGTVIKRGPSKWCVVLDLGTGPDGKRNRQWHSGYPSEEEAEKARTELLGKLDHGSYIKPTNLTVRAFFEGRWFATLDTRVNGGKIKPNTRSNYRRIAEAYILPKLGHLLLKDLSADMLALFYGELLESGRLHPAKGGGSKTLSPTTVRLVHVTLHRALGDAKRWHLVTDNAAVEASEDAPERRKTSKVMRVWEPDQLRHFLETVSANRLRAMWMLFCTTGLRRGEVVGLRWSDLDLDAARLTVEQALVVVNHNVIVSTPKSDRVRTLSLDPATVAALRSHKTRQGAERLSWGPAYQSTELLFTWEDGRPLHPDVVSRTFGRLAEQAELPSIRLHDLRHSYASAALKAGVHMKVVQERLGHSSIAVTGDVYSHVAPDVDQAAADRVAGVILGTAN